MWKAWACLLPPLLLLTTTVRAEGTPREPSSLRPLPRRTPGARAQWPHRARDDSSHRRPAEGVSHGTTAGAPDSHSEYPTHSATTVAEYWRPGSANLTATSTNAYAYAYAPSRPYYGLTGGNAPHLKDVRGSIYYQSRPVKKNHPHYVFGRVQLHGGDGSKTKYTKTVPHPSAPVHATYKKPLHPRVHKPYAKHKYPTQKTVHPPYRRFFQSPYQRYAIPAAEILRQKVTQNDHSRRGSSPAAAPDGHHTTERMDDAHSEGSAPSEDYAHYNDTQQNPGGNYYDAYEELDGNAPEETAPHDETATRGYYGDRIYMSTHVPLGASDKGATKNSYFILRRTSDGDDDDDDIETIFE